MRLLVPNAPLPIALLLAISACSTSSPQPSSPSPPNDAAACDSASCAAPGDDAPSGDSPGGDALGGDDAGSMPGIPDLCPSRGPVVPPLPAGVAIAYQLPAGSDTIDGFLVDDSAIVWKDQKKIVRVSLSDGAETTILDHSASSDDSVGSIALDATDVYFSDATGPFSATPSLGIAKYPVTGAGSATTVVNDPTAGLLAIADGYIYYEHRNIHGTYQSDIARVPTVGGMPTTLVRGVVNGVRGLAVGGGYVYFLGTVGGFSYSSYYLARVAVTAQAPDPPEGGVVEDAGPTADAGVQPPGSELVATTGFNVSGPATDSTNVYWGSDDKLMAAPLSGGSPATLAQADPISGMFPMTATVYGIVPHGGSVYWSSAGCEAIRKSPITGGAATTIVPNVSAGAIGINSTHLYFAPTSTQILSGPL